MILKAENISKQYRLGTVGAGTLGDDLKRIWYKIQGKEDPFLKVGAVNQRNSKADGEDYVWALRDINFEVNEGEVLGIIGKNGAGKSTLLKLLSRVTAPTTGSIKTKGRIASLLEVGTGFHGELTGRENIFMNGAVLGMTKTEIRKKLDEIIAFSGCERYIDTPVKRYSSGMTVRLGFAVAAHLEPDILVVDEVLAVGDAEFQKKAIGKMQNLSEGQGRTVLFVSHNMASIQSLCTRALLLEDGQIIMSGRPSDVVDNYISIGKNDLIDHAVINDDHRRFETSPKVILKSIRIKNEKVLVRESILLEVELDVKIQQIGLSFSGSFCSMDDTRIGSFFTKKFDYDVNNSRLLFEIPHHNLAPGKYYLNIAVSKGNLESDNLKMLDHAYKCLIFEIKQEFKNSEFLTEWNKDWGKTFFPSMIKMIDE